MASQLPKGRTAPDAGLARSRSNLGAAPAAASAATEYYGANFNDGEDEKEEEADYVYDDECSGAWNQIQDFDHEDGFAGAGAPRGGSTCQLQPPAPLVAEQERTNRVLYGGADPRGDANEHDELEKHVRKKMTVLGLGG